MEFLFCGEGWPLFGLKHSQKSVCQRPGLQLGSVDMNFKKWRSGRFYMPLGAYLSFLSFLFLA